MYVSGSCEGGGIPGPSSPLPVAAVTAGPVLARVAPAEEPWLTEAGARLRAGELVAFPTGAFRQEERERGSVGSCFWSQATRRFRSTRFR